MDLSLKFSLAGHMLMVVIVQLTPFLTNVEKKSQLVGKG